MNCSDRRIVIVGSGIENSISDYLFDQVKKGLYLRTEYIDALDFKGTVLPFLHRALYSRYLSEFKLYRFIDWTKYYSLNKIDIADDTIILFNLASLFRRYIDKDFLRNLKKNHPKTTLIWLLVDSLDGDDLQEDIEQWKILFDRCITFDPNDAHKYAMEYRMLPYEKNNSFYSNINIPISDLFYIGREKARSVLLSKLATFFRENNLKFEIIEVSKRIRLSRKTKRVRGLVPYEDVLKRIMDSNCILEVINNGGGTTLRYYEAVVYNKKLLTNNRNVEHLPFYDERYMKCFESIDDIDCEWIRRVEQVDYSYDGRFGLNLFLEYIRS